MLTYLRPQTIDEAAGYLGGHDGAKILAGGTDIIAGIRDGVRPSYLIDIKRIPGLGTIESSDEGLCIGAAAVMNDVMNCGHITGCYSIINDAGLVFANYPLRNRATLLGNLCSAQPAGDMIPVALVLGGYIEAVSSNGSRQIPVREFFTAFKTSALRSDELAVRVVFPKREGKGVFLKKKRTCGHDLAQVSVAAFRSADGAYDFALGAASAVPVLVQFAARPGGKPDPDAMAGKALASVSPIDDVRSTRQYRLDIAAHFIKKAVAMLEGPENRGAEV